MAINPPLGQPGPLGRPAGPAGPTIGGGLISGAAAGVGSLFAPAARAQEQRISILAGQQAQERATGARLGEAALRGRAGRQPKFTLTSQLRGAETALKTAQSGLQDVLDPQKQLGITVGLGLEKEQIPEFVSQRKATVSRLSGNLQALGRVNDTLTFLSDDNPDEARFLVDLAGRIQSGPLKAGAAQLTFKAKDSLGQEKEFNQQMTKFFEAEAKIINEDPRLSPAGKATARDIVNIFLTQRVLPQFLEKTARPTGQTIKLEETPEIGAAVATAEKPPDLISLLESLNPRLLQNRRQTLLEGGQAGRKDRAVFKSSSGDAIAKGVAAALEGGSNINLRPEATGLSREDTEFYVKRLLAGSKAIVINPQLPERFQTIVSGPLTIDEQSIISRHARLVQEATDVEAQVKELSEQERAQQLLQQVGQVGVPQQAGDLEAPGLLGEQPEVGDDISLLPPEVPEGAFLEEQAGGLPPLPEEGLLPLSPGFEPQALAPVGQLGLPGQVGQLPVAPDAAQVSQLQELRERFRAPRVDTTVPTQVARLSEEMLRGQSLSPASREVFAETIGAAFDPEDIDELSEEFGFLNDLEGPVGIT